MAKKKAKSLNEKVADQVQENAMRVVALPVDPVKLAEVIAREVCRQHGATYRGYRFKNKAGVLEVSALGILANTKYGQTVIVGDIPIGVKGFVEANEAP